MKRIVLVRPQGPRNVGSILRLIANFGPADLVLVQPAKPSLMIHPDLEQMSHGVEDVLSRVRIVDTLEEVLVDCTGSYGFTARARDHRELRDWRAVQADVIQRTADEEERIALVFGSEENGLTGSETDLLHELVRMPTSDEHGSINLAMSVGICLSTLFFADASSAESSGSTPLPGSQRIFLAERLKETLGNQATSEPARRDLVASIGRVFARAPLETRDARAWHLLARALGSEKTPLDFGLAPEPASGEEA